MQILDLAPVAPDSLSDDELLRRFSALGHCGKVAVRRALSLLPEILRRGLERKAGATSGYELAQKKVGVSRDVIDKILRLHGRIGHLPELWGLLVDGLVGWSKLEIVAGLATAATSAWWAERTRTCTQAELTELVRRYKAQTQQTASRASEPSSTASTASRSGAPETLQWERMTQMAFVARLDAVESDLDEPAGIPFPAIEPPVSMTRVPPTAQTLPLALPTEEAQTAASPPFSSADLGTLRAVTVYLCAEDEALLRAWRETLCRIRRSAVSLGETVALLLNGDISEAPCPRCQGPVHPAAAAKSADSLLMSHEPYSGLPAEPPPGRALQADPAGEAQANPRDELPGDSNAGLPDEGKTDSGAEAAPNLAKGTPQGGLSPASVPRILEVVVRVAELGSTWIGHLRGVLPVGIAATFHSREAIVLGDLYAKAVEAASRCKSDRIPGSVRKFVAIRSGFHCETPDCRRRLEEIHHIKPHAEGGTHHPDNLRSSCRLHHTMDHGGLYSDAAAGTVVQPGDPDRSTDADRAFRTIRAQVMAMS